ncbi:FAD:protein FMN transferase [Ideonella sp. YS5]|uniref:FAD:protein FMN transferase n=1 Tax=Ideonella sp. YS5 TaxID=3453714 RepID=UPI003EEB0E42
MFSALSTLRSRFAGSSRAAPSQAGWFKREEAIMGTAISVELWACSRAEGEAAIDAVMGEMHRIDRTMSPHKPDSELSRINRDAGRGPVRLSAEMAALVGRAIEFSRWSDGAFDITYASVGQLYDYRAGVAPDDETLAAARQAIGWQELLLEGTTLRFGHPGMRIDLGGFAKGHAVDRSIAILRERGIAHAMVSAGGDSHLLGDHRGRPWMIAVRDPRRQAGAVAVLPLQDVAVSTSGDYERFFVKGGVRHHHLIDPRTGRSPSGVRSVTIVADDGLTSEALSKTVFVLGRERGLALIESVPGTDAVVVDAEGQLHYSAGLLQPD